MSRECLSFTAPCARNEKEDSLWYLERRKKQSWQAEQYNRWICEKGWEGDSRWEWESRIDRQPGCQTYRHWGEDLMRCASRGERWEKDGGLMSSSDPVATATVFTVSLPNPQTSLFAFSCSLSPRKEICLKCSRNKQPHPVYTWY